MKNKLFLIAISHQLSCGSPNPKDLSRSRNSNSDDLFHHVYLNKDASIEDFQWHISMCNGDSINMRKLAEMNAKNNHYWIIEHDMVAPSLIEELPRLFAEEKFLAQYNTEVLHMGCIGSIEEDIYNSRIKDLLLQNKGFDYNKYWEETNKD